MKTAAYASAKYKGAKNFDFELYKRIHTQVHADLKRYGEPVPEMKKGRLSTSRRKTILSYAKYLPLPHPAECPTAQAQVDVGAGDVAVNVGEEEAEVEVVEVGMEEGPMPKVQADGYLMKIGRPCLNMRKRKYIMSIAIMQNGKLVS